MQSETQCANLNCTGSTYDPYRYCYNCLERAGNTFIEAANELDRREFDHQLPSIPFGPFVWY